MYVRAFDVSSLIIHYLCYFQEFLQWIRNTWRPVNNREKTKEKQYKITDILWWERKEEIMNEIANLMGMDSVDTNTKGWFQHRMAASQNVLKKMTDEEQKQLRKKGEEMQEGGMPEELKRK
jgi:hypothetical protein